jgi:DNA mismatch repair protein MutL
MPNIPILSDTLISKIAAGEVIERPASIVRELVDNSIDAGAKNISVDVLYGGKKLIRVVDDGIGMDREDAILCFERHATSKIKTEEDLFNIHTLGFRGEALPSIASVSKVVLFTCKADSPIGTKVEIAGGQRKTVTDAPPISGTTLEVRDIFYNTPARKKFLKSTATEASHIIDIIMQKALSYPSISFNLRHNNSEVINVSSVKDLKERFIQLYSEEIFNEFVEIKRGDTGIKVYGFISVPQFARSTKNYQLVFINRRPVRNPTVTHAVYNVYRDIISKDKHPAFFLFIDIDTTKVDVNVHPTKREVRFESPDEIHRTVEFAIKEALYPKKTREYIDYIPESKTIKESKEMDDGSHLVRETLESALQSEGELQTDIFVRGLVPVVEQFFYIGESFYAKPTGDGLMVIDQHAAHERVLYEKLLKKTDIEVENLFLPLRIDLPAREFNIIMNYRMVFQELGIYYEDFGGNSIIIRSLPKELRRADIKGLILDIASEILDREDTGAEDEIKKKTLLQSIAAAIACHKSVRGKEQLNNEELSHLLSELEKTKAPDRCPHGRPTRVFFSLDELKKMFKRK